MSDITSEEIIEILEGKIKSLDGIFISDEDSNSFFIEGTIYKSDLKEVAQAILDKIKEKEKQQIEQYEKDHEIFDSII
jgi:hypothetical protein